MEENNTEEQVAYKNKSVQSAFFKDNQEKVKYQAKLRMRELRRRQKLEREKIEANERK